MKNELITEYHTLIKDLNRIDSTIKWEEILEEEGFDYNFALSRVEEEIRNSIISLLLDDNNKMESYVIYLNCVKDIMKRSKPPYKL